jgi:hypothetical protein
MLHVTPKACLLIAGALFVFSAGQADAEPPETLAYDGFATGGSGGTYRNHIRLAASGPATAEVIGFDGTQGWGGSTSHFHTRFGRELTHNLLEKTSKGSLGHWTFNGHRSVGRLLPGAPTAKSGVYTLCLLYLAHENPFTKATGKDGHTTNFEGKYGMIGFTSGKEGIGGDARGGNNGCDGLSIGYYEDDLRVFAGGKSFTILEGYKMGVTYLLMAEMTVSKDGPEGIRGFWAANGDKALTPAKFNSENGGKGAQAETWSSPADLMRLEIYTQDPAISPPQASLNDSKKEDFITWDEVRLMDGKAVVPVPHIAAKGAMVAPLELLKARADLPEKLVACWPFDEGAGQTVKDAAGNADGAIIGSTWIDDGVLGKAMRFTAKQGPKGGPHHATAVAVAHETAVKAGFPWERHHKFTYSAWVRGTDGFKGMGDIITKCNGANATERKFADIKGIAFMVAGGNLELEMVNSINFPQPDMRIKVRSKLNVPGDGKWHHVAATYDGSCKPAGVTFYVDGVRDGGFSFNFADIPNQPKELTLDVGVLSPYCIGGRDRRNAEDPVSALASGYAMSGDIDEVGVFSYALSGPYVVAIHSLAAEKDLGYSLVQVNRIIDLHKAKKGDVKIGEKTWTYAEGLKGDLGKVVRDGGQSSIRLADDGSGVAAK